MGPPPPSRAPSKAQTTRPNVPHRQDSRYLGRAATNATSDPPKRSDTKSKRSKVPHPHLPSHHKDYAVKDGANSSARTSDVEAPVTVSSRPTGAKRLNSVQSRYVRMLLAVDTIPRFHNILSSFFTWILLAGFLIFPGTFTSLQTSLTTDPQTGVPQEVKKDLLDQVKNIPLLAIGGAAAIIGGMGMCWLWWRWHDNYVWLLNKIFLPGFLNCFAGLISTLINVYTQQSGDWSVTAKVTAIVTGACMGITGGLFALYNFWALSRIKKSHSKEMGGDENIKEKIQRKAEAPPLEPGSVV